MALSRFALVLAKSSHVGTGAMGHFHSPNLLILFTTYGNHILNGKVWVGPAVAFNSTSLYDSSVSSAPSNTKALVTQQSFSMFPEAFYTFLS